MTPEYLIELVKWGINVAFWPAIAFTPVISFFWPWWKSFWGINIVTLELAIALALIVSIVHTDFGVAVVSNLALAWTEVIALWLVGIIIIWRGALVIITQVRGNRLSRNNQHGNHEVITSSEKH